MRNTITVAIRFERFDPVGLKNACSIALSLFGFTIKEWKSAIIAPSYSTPPSWLRVIGLKDFQRMLSQMLVAMNKEIPDPMPYPFCMSSSRRITRIPAKTS